MKSDLLNSRRTLAGTLDRATPSYLDLSVPDPSDAPGMMKSPVCLLKDVWELSLGGRQRKDVLTLKKWFPSCIP